MHQVDFVYDTYRRARRKFSLITYLLLALWLLLALVQWLLITLVAEMNRAFRVHYYISLAAFLLAIVLFAVFLFYENARRKPAAAIILSILIVELQVIAAFTLLSYTRWLEMLIFFSVCALLIIIFVIIGILLPRKMDLTLHVALLFIVSFLFLLIGVYFLMLHLIGPIMHPYGYMVWQISITITLLFFVMYHAQTINGSRFAEMRLHDYCLGSLILFHDFLIIFLLTLYWHLYTRVLTAPAWNNTVPWNNTNVKLNNLGDDDLLDKFDNMSNRKYRSKLRTKSETTEMALTLDFLTDDMSTFSNSFKGDWPDLFEPEPNENPEDFQTKRKDQLDQEYAPDPDESTIYPEDKVEKANSRKTDESPRDYDSFKE